MTPGRAVAAGMALAIGLAAGCSGGGDDAPFALDGSPRIPDDAGVLTGIEGDRMELDGDQQYRISDELASFSTYTLELEPMVRRRGQYVHVGLDGDTVVWMAGIAAVFPGDPPTVIYDGELEAVDGDRLVFVDGTVLELGSDLEAPEPGGRLVVRIDAERDVVIELLDV